MGEYRVEMEKMGFHTLEALEAEVQRVRGHLVNITLRLQRPRD